MHDAEWRVLVCPECYRAAPKMMQDSLCHNHQGTPKRMAELIPASELTRLREAVAEHYEFGHDIYQHVDPLHQQRFSRGLSRLHRAAFDPEERA